MADPENANDQGVLVETARALGTAAGKVASALGAKGEAAAPADPRLYQAEYVGSGTFIIRKPSRKRAKTRQSQLKNPQRGARK
jgi:hypothetical protein